MNKTDKGSKRPTLTKINDKDKKPFQWDTTDLEQEVFGNAHR